MRTKQTARISLGKSPRPHPSLKKLASKQHGPIGMKKSRKSLTPSGSSRKPHRWRPGTVALREIRKYQRDTGTLMRKAPMYRLIRETIQDFGMTETRITRTALEALHQSAEAYLVQLFQDMNDAAIHSNRVTIMPKDLRVSSQIAARHSGQVFPSDVGGRMPSQWRPPRTISTVKKVVKKKTPPTHRPAEELAEAVQEAMEVERSGVSSSRAEEQEVEEREQPMDLAEPDPEPEIQPEPEPEVLLPPSKSKAKPKNKPQAAEQGEFNMSMFQ